MARVESIARAVAEVGRACDVDVSLHLDHVTDMRLLRTGADAGFSSAMLDAGALPYAENVAATRAAVLPPGGQAPPPSADLSSVTCQLLGDLLVVVGPRCRVAQAGERGEEESPFELLVAFPGGLLAADRGT